MNCPTCAKSLEDGLAFCPHCDAVLDQSVLAPVADAEDELPSPSPAPPLSSPPAPGPRRPAPGPRRPAPPPPRAAAVSARPSAMPAAATYPSPVPAALAPTLGPDGESGEYSAPMAELDAMLAGFRRIAFEDRLTAAGALALVVVNLLPWRSTLKTDDFGFQTWGVLTALVGLATLFLVWVRVSGKLPELPRRYVPQLQLAAAAVAGLIALAFIATNFERKELWGRVIWVSRPTAGAFLAIGAAAVQGVGAWLTKLRGDR